MVVNTADGLGYLLSASAFLVKEGPCWNCFLLQKNYSEPLLPSHLQHFPDPLVHQTLSGNVRYVFCEELLFLTIY